ncbi:MAG: ATP-binding protein [Coriobacteriales bacterium]|jgi:hypothetical protein|nr:ATP-binding protein [Coriobacteriales bacterium]
MYAIAVVGAPCSGKTHFTSSFTLEGWLVIRTTEISSMVRKCGYIAVQEDECIQHALTVTRMNEMLEDHFFSLFASSPKTVVLCDNGLATSFAFCSADVLAANGYCLEESVARYDCVIQFLLPKHESLYNHYRTNNPARTENYQESLALQATLGQIWSRHANYHVVEFQEKVDDKMREATTIVANAIKRGTGVGSPCRVPPDTLRPRR